MLRQKIISKLNSNAKDFTPLFQRNKKKEVPLKDNKGIKTSTEMKVKRKEERNWKELKCKTIMKTNFKDNMNYRSKRDEEDKINRFELLLEYNEIDDGNGFGVKIQQE